MQALSTLTGFFAIPFRQWRKRHAPKQRQQPIELLEDITYPYPGARFGIRLIRGEWWVCAPDGVRTFPKGPNRQDAFFMANALSKEADATIRRMSRTEANREAIAKHVRENFDCMPNGGAR